MKKTFVVFALLITSVIAGYSRPLHPLPGEGTKLVLELNGKKYDI